MSNADIDSPSVEGEVEGGLDDPADLEPDQGSLRLDTLGPGESHAVSEWEAAAAAVLRKSGKIAQDDPDSDVWARLTKRTLDGIEVTPLGTSELLDSVQTQGRPTRHGAWDIRAHVPSGSTNEEVLVDLNGGVNSLLVDADAQTDLSALLDGVMLDLAPVVLDAGDDQEAVARALIDHLDGDDVHAHTNLGGRADSLEVVAALAVEHGILGVVVDGSTLNDQGASDAQELGYAMAIAVSYLRRLSEAGHSIGEIAGLMEFRLVATDEQFPTIAKLRAARRLWARALELSGLPADEQPPMRIHAVTGHAMMSAYDPYVNMLRTTIAAFAAGVGGADSVTVLPFDSPLGRPEAFGRRIARNTSALLISESHVARVSDPAGGSYAVEKLTDDLAQLAWTELGRIDSEGGPGEQLDARVTEIAGQREKQVATRKRPITGLTEFPNLGEERPEREATGGPAETARRYGAAFEELRAEPAGGSVFLATMGPIAAHTARATFATNLLAAGGIDVDVAGPTDGPEDLVAAYEGQQVVCLAGTDDGYQEWGEKAVDVLREAGASHVVIAGQPVAYVDDSCAMGIDALRFLTETRRRLA